MIITSDLHMHNFEMFSENTSTPYINSRAMELLDSLDYIRLWMKETEENNLLILGDIFHVKNYINVPIYVAMYKKIKQFKESGIDVYILAGNHDMYTRGGLIHSLIPFKDIATVWDIQTVARIESYKIQAIPYIKDEEKMKEILDKICEDECDGEFSDILLMHQIFKGVNVAGGYSIKDSLTFPKKLMNKFKWIFSGDAHACQMMSTNFIYPGSLVSHSFSDKGDTKQFFVLSKGSDPIAVVNPVSPYFMKYVDGSEWPDCPEYAGKESYAYVWIVTKDKDKDWDKFLSKKFDKYKYRVDVDIETSDNKECLDIGSMISPEDVIRKFSASVQMSQSMEKEYTRIGLDILAKAVK